MRCSQDGGIGTEEQCAFLRSALRAGTEIQDCMESSLRSTSLARPTGALCATIPSSHTDNDLSAAHPEDPEAFEEGLMGRPTAEHFYQNCKVRARGAGDAGAARLALLRIRQKCCTILFGCPLCL
ncbi:hypothetical protein NDU88_003715 [Pleurodeles waltl]|uniref:Uncharacterized protein n=1 Tax=Pleurodeles waltl TaxID=8319 RepID=A0AAV7QAG2_PLEWA|nr:hypothetical protein NDU88_003715 [Pleurodeles waltl]